MPRAKRARVIRNLNEFDASRIRSELRQPVRGSSVYSWSLEDIREARDAQLRGEFKLAARLSKASRTDEAIYVARENRLAPPKAMSVAIESTGSKKADAIANEAEALYGQDGIGLTSDTVAEVHECLAEHGVAFATNTFTTRNDGSRSDVVVSAWPIDFVRWDPMRGAFVTQVHGGGHEVIRHGDGRWIVFQRYELEPWARGALVPAALVWARHAFGMRDWGQGSATHGNAKVIGEMPQGVPLQDAEGKLTAEAAAFLELLKAVAGGDLPVGIRPAGSKTDYLANTSTAWQVWSELAGNAEKAAARIYNGTDGTLGATGGAPGVDIQALFGVAATIVEGDIGALQRGFHTGSIEPWCAVNFGDSTLAPRRVYQVPDVDADARRESLAKRYGHFFDTVERARALNLGIDEVLLAEMLGLPPLQAPTSGTPELLQQQRRGRVDAHARIGGSLQLFRGRS